MAKKTETDRADVIENSGSSGRTDETGNRLEDDYNIIHEALASSINGVIITDLPGKIKYVNDAFLKMFEYNDKTEVLGKFAHEFFVEGKIKNIADIEKMINGSNSTVRDFKVQQKGNARFWVEVSSSIVTDKDGVSVGRIASFVDITRRKKTEAENRKLTAKLIRSQEQERQRIAQDLHDSIGQTIHAAKLNLVAFQKNPEKFKDNFKIGLNFLDVISQELREVCNDLYPSILQDHGLETAIRWHIKNYLELNNIKTNITIDVPDGLDNDLEIQIYRIVKEVFSNIIKHSRATTVNVNLTHQNTVIYLLIDDNGVGFEPHLQQNNRGFGLLNIQQRVFELNGVFQINSQQGRGTKITIILDIDNEKYD